MRLTIDSTASPFDQLLIECRWALWGRKSSSVAAFTFFAHAIDIGIFCVGTVFYALRSCIKHTVYTKALTMMMMKCSSAQKQLQHLMQPFVWIAGRRTIEEAGDRENLIWFGMEKSRFSIDAPLVLLFYVCDQLKIDLSSYRSSSNLCKRWK